MRLTLVHRTLMRVEFLSYDDDASSVTNPYLHA